MDGVDGVTDKEPNNNSVTSHHTNFGSDGSPGSTGHVAFLDQHTIACPANSSLKYFQLQNRKGKREYRYNFDCRNTRNTKSNQHYTF